jgi:SAM-dependent methyltransferase
MDAQAWNERYAARELVWSAEPNRFVAEVVGPLPPGRALDLACGEGRNAIWMAEQGWRVSAVDFSDVAVAKGKELAERRREPSGAPLDVDWRCADVTRWQPPARAFDLGLLGYRQLPADDLAAGLARARAALAPGGRLLVIGHARRNLDEGVGGPQDPAVLYEPEDVLASLERVTAGAEGARSGSQGGGDGEEAEVVDVERAEYVYRSVSTDEGERRAIDTLVLARSPGDPPRVDG